MNDLEMYRESLALCDDKIIDVLVERSKIVEKIMHIKRNMVCRFYSRSRRQNRPRDWKKS